MKTATLELPAVLVHAIEDFNFAGKPLWRIGEGLDHVTVVLTFNVNDEPTDQQARAVRDRSQPANSKRRRRRRQQQQPIIQRQPPPRETAPPTIETSPAPPPATISYQRPHCRSPINRSRWRFSQMTQPTWTSLSPIPRRLLIRKLPKYALTRNSPQRSGHVQLQEAISTLRFASRLPIRPGTEEATTKFRRLITP